MFPWLPLPERVTIREIDVSSNNLYRYRMGQPTDVQLIESRSVTKARDLFDLDLLLRRLETQEPSKPSLRPDYASLAASKAREISYASFRSEVLPFLDLDVVALYQSYDAWEHIRESVAERLEQIAQTGEGQQ